MSKKLIYSILLIAVFAGSTHAQFISSVVHRNTDTDAPEPPEIAPNPLDEDELTFVDRTHQYNDIPVNLIGAQYVLTANDNKNISGYELDVTMEANATLYIFVDNRMGSSDGGMGVDPDIAGMGWLTDMGFVDTGDDIGIDESGDGDIDQYSSVFSMPVLAGTTITLRGNTEGHGGNMYGVAALGPKLKAYNPDPADGTLYGGTWVSLDWSPGDSAVSHDVYLGENFDDVNDGTADTFRVNQTETDLFIGFIGYPYPDGLVTGTTYYWRIDEVEADGTTIYKGNVWSFTIPYKIAYNPDPADGARYVDPNVELNWTAGLGAELHYVYFGDNFDDVNSADGAFFQAETTYTPGTLEVDKTYYWRVDEFDFYTTLKGDVWSFSTVPDIPITDPNLLCWWKFDEGSDTTAVDYSGHNNHGTLMGDPQWVDGQVGGALEFGGDGGHVVDEDAENYLNGLNALTVCIWVKSDVIDTNKGFIIGEQPNGSDSIIAMRYDSAGGNGGGTNVLKMAVTSTEDEQQLESSNNAQKTEWQHYSMVWSSGQQLNFYINGVLDVPTDNQPATTGTTTGCSALIIGKGSKDEGAGAGWDGLIDDVRIYNKVLTADDIKEVMRGEPDLAWNPNPAKGSTAYIGDATPLNWSPGDKAAQHDVYFGIDKDVVADANTSTTDIYRGRQFGTSYTPLEGVEWGGGPYYWRIDEYNTDATISEGRIWNFTVADFILVDDFESYNDLDTDNPESNRIYNVWIDGWGVDTNGSEVGYATPDFPGGEHFVETNIVHGGSQSMPYFYDTNFKYSEATYSPTQRDWTEEGVGVLSLWFRGNPAGLLEGPAGTYTMRGAGADIWDQADEFRYAWKQLSGAGTISAQVLSVQNTNGWAKVGVMIRESLDPGSKFAALYITPGNGCRFQARLVTGVDAVSDSDVTTLADIEAPHWIKLERDAAGNFNAYNSDDGVTWTPLAWNPQNISMGTNVYIGLALTSHNSGVTCVAEFSDVETTGAVTPLTWTHEAIGATMAASDPAPMYVALNGGTAVYHGDLNAPLIDTWTEWTIDLQEFTGVNLTNVNTLAIGFGDKNNLQPGGTGMVLFDDIRLYRPAEPQP